MEVIKVKIDSSAFHNGDVIPIKYTGDGENVSPPLFWEYPPPNTKSQVLICDDPDAPSGDWVHWILFNIPANEHELPEHLTYEEIRKKGMIPGYNDFRKTTYGGPCPPRGTHRYYFRIFALDKKLDIPEGSNKKEVISKMKGHVIDKGELVGLYSR